MTYIFIRGCTLSGRVLEPFGGECLTSLILLLLFVCKVLSGLISSSDIFTFPGSAQVWLWVIYFVLPEPHFSQLLAVRRMWAQFGFCSWSKEKVMASHWL